MRSYILSIISNKYFIAFAAVIIWLLFFERHSVIQQWKVNSGLKELKKDKAFYEKEIYRDSISIEEIKNDPEALERLAREKYYMKKENEVIFIIEEKVED